MRVHQPMRSTMRAAAVILLVGVAACQEDADIVVQAQRTSATASVLKLTLCPAVEAGACRDAIDVLPAGEAGPNRTVGVYLDGVTEVELFFTWTTIIPPGTETPVCKCATVGPGARIDVGYPDGSCVVAPGGTACVTCETVGTCPSP